MARLLMLAALVFGLAGAAAGQTLGTLRVTVLVTDTDGSATPAPRHALLVSDNPPTAEPRRILTGLDGSVSVGLRPGNYTVESDRPLAFRGRRYQWLQTVDIAAGRDTVLELTAANAVPADEDAAAASEPGGGSDPGFLLHDWQHSVAAIWTPGTRASGVLVDAKGLVLTTQRTIGTATAVEVQLSPAVKVAARVLAADAGRDVAILWIDSTVAAGIRPAPLVCAPPPSAPEAGARLFAIGVPLRGDTDMTSGRAAGATSGGATPGAIATDFVLPSGSAGGPVFVETGALIGLTSLAPAAADRSQPDAHVVPIANACAVLVSAEQAMKSTPPPSATRLPVDPTRPFPADALAAAVERRAGSLKPYLFSSADFDIALLTPIAVHAELNVSSANRRTTSKETRDPKADFSFMRPRMDFGVWADYVADIRPVLLVRLTPRFAEGFWAKVGRVAAETQGVMLPQMKRYRSGFGRLRVLCGPTEVLPIHPFELETRITETATIDEGLYAFDAAALGPHCGTVAFELQAAATPDKVDTRVVDPAIVEQVWQDFAPFREAEQRAAAPRPGPAR